MANQHTKKRDPMADIVLPGPSNEEIQAKEEAKRAADPFHGRVSVGAEEHDKQFDAWADLDYDPLGLSDPLAALKRAHEKPGMSLKLLSPDVMNRIGRR